MRQREPRSRDGRIGAGFFLAVLLSGAIAAPASAAVILDEQGQPGIYSVGDFDNLPGARCGYSAENAAGDAFFRWMKFRKPVVYARDTSPGTDQQRVKVTYRVHRDSGTGWTTVASASQTKTAYDNQPGDFVGDKVYYKGRAGELVRGLVVIQWLRDGSAEASVKLRLEHYSVKWTVGTPDYQYVDACDGASD